MNSSLLFSISVPEQTQKTQSRLYYTACFKCSRTTLELVPEINAAASGNALYYSSISVLKIYLENCAVRTPRFLCIKCCPYSALNAVRTPRFMCSRTSNKCRSYTSISVHKILLDFCAISLPENRANALARPPSLSAQSLLRK